MHQASPNCIHSRTFIQEHCELSTALTDEDASGQTTKKENSLPSVSFQIRTHPGRCISANAGEQNKPRNGGVVPGGGAAVATLKRLSGEIPTPRKKETTLYRSRSC